MQEQPLAAPPPVIGQRLLFSPEIETAYEKEEREGRYTLERFKLRRPETYKDCVNMLVVAKPGYEGLRRIAKRLKVHWLTVAGVRADAGETIDTLRSRLSEKALTAVELLMDRVLEDPDAIPVNVIGMSMDQLVRIAELLGNRVTSRIEHVERIDIHSNFEEFLTSNLPTEKQLDESEVREIAAGSGMDSGGRKMLAIGPPAPADPVARTDVESVVSAPSTQEPKPGTTTLPTIPAPVETLPEAQNGGGGGRFSPTGVLRKHMDPNAQKFSGNDPSSE